MRKNNEPEELETLDNEQQQDNSDLNENDSNELLDDDNGDNEYNPEVTEDIELKEEYNDSEYHSYNKIIPPEYNDQEFDSLSKTEQNKIVRDNIISVIAFFIFFLIIFQIIL